MTDRTNFGLMYTTCMFCHRALGVNAVIENFPFGRRLAFDAAKGRLWVVCRACERWNLTPLETRWEAVEECERKFVAARLRVSTDNIGLARLSEGLELVRIGEPRRPEFAAWRYGDQFGRRRTRSIMIGGGIVVAAGAIIGGAAAAGIGLVSLVNVGNVSNLYVTLRSRVRLKADDGRIIKLKYAALQGVQLIVGPENSPAVRLDYKNRSEVFTGDQGLRIARRLVPAINSSGGSADTVQAAVTALQTSSSAEAFVADTARSNVGRAAWAAKPIAKLPAVTRLALEMALHEDAERRAIEGELSVLEAAWREAEEIAAIADNMFTSVDVETKLERMKRSTTE